MHRAVRFSGALVGIAMAAIAGAARETPVHAQESACIHVLAQARYGAIGYNHIVQIANSCDLPFDCTVSTDVNPEAQRTSVPPRSQIEVVTFLGSPARVFTPKVACVARR